MPYSFKAGLQAAYWQYHDGAKCDGCSDWIMGNRYFCNSCKANLCEKCHAEENYGTKSDEHSDFHICETILCSLDKLSTPAHKGINCDGCRIKDIFTRRYKCNVCHDYDLCESCYDNKIYAPVTNKVVSHRASHQMTYWDPPIAEAENLSYDQMHARAIKLQQRLGIPLSKLGALEYKKEGGDDDWYKFHQKIGYAIYGDPRCVRDTAKNCYFGYSPEQEDLVRELVGKCLELNRKHHSDESVRADFIFVSFFMPGKFENTIPLVRVYTSKYNYLVEPSGRAYDNWKHFLETNCLPECHIIGPDEGTYKCDDEGRLLLYYYYHDPSWLKSTGGSVVDGVATVGTVLGTTLGVISLFTPLAPVAAVTMGATMIGSGGWFTFRSGAAIVDRIEHEETVNPFASKDAFFCWLSIVGTAAGLGSYGATMRLASLARTGSRIGMVTRVIANTAIFGSLGINGIGVISNYVMIAKDISEGRKPSALQLFQLCTSVLFFTNSVLNVQTANGIIKEAVTNDLKRIQNLLPTEEERRFFGNIMKERNGEGLQEMLAHMKKAEALKAQTNPDLHQATQRHAAMSNDLRNGPAAMGKLDEATLARAEFAHETRKGGSLAHKKSTNTVFAIGQEELQRRIDQRIGADQQVGRHDITLRGTYQAVDWEINPLTGTKTRTYYEVRDPVFGVDNGKAIHLNSKGTYSKVEIPGQRFYEAYQKVDGIPAVYCARRRRNSGANAQ